MKCSDEKLNAVLHSNRAQVALNMKEYARALNDAQAAVALDPTHIKSCAARPRGRASLERSLCFVFEYHIAPSLCALQ